MKTPGDTMAHHWGKSTLLALQPDCACVRLVSAGVGGKSSIHRHDHWHQTLVVVTGTVRIEIFRLRPLPNERSDSLGLQVDSSRVLYLGDTIELWAGTIHRLSFPIPSVAIEVYTPRCYTELPDRSPFEDIARYNEGEPAE